MHQFLEAIGFADVKTRQQERELLDEIEKRFTDHELISLGEEDFCEFRREYGAGIGIKVYGEMNEYEEFTREYYFPYFKGNGATTHADIVVERVMDQEAYLGVCEDARVGVSIIFQVQNGIEYMRELQLGNLSKHSVNVTLSGLAMCGKVLLPIIKNDAAEKAKREESRNRMMLQSAARNGSREAIESLTKDDIELYTQVSRRIAKEDILSIVETHFMPCGLECTKYAILGVILDMSIVANEESQKSIYVLTLDVNDLIFDVCVPVEKVMGEPEIGRRFKADIWLQGHINF